MIYERALTVKQLADRWVCSADVIYDMLRGGLLKGFKVGNSWRISPKEIQDYENNKEEYI